MITPLSISYQQVGLNTTQQPITYRGGGIPQNRPIGKVENDRTIRESDRQWTYFEKVTGQCPLEQVLRIHNRLDELLPPLHNHLEARPLSDSASVLSALTPLVDRLSYGTLRVLQRTLMVVGVCVCFLIDLSVHLNWRTPRMLLDCGTLCNTVHLILPVQLSLIHLPLVRTSSSEPQVHSRAVESCIIAEKSRTRGVEVRTVSVHGRPKVQFHVISG